MAVQPVGARLLVEQMEKEVFQTASGIVLGEERLPQSVKLKVIAVGADCVHAKVGDIVLVSQYAPTEAREKPTDKTMIVVEADVLAFIR